jgi:hypothetical protein
VPFRCLNSLQEWAESPLTPFHEENAWVRTLVHEEDVQLIAELKKRAPHWLLSSTGPTNPWLKTAC